MNDMSADAGGLAVTPPTSILPIWTNNDRDVPTKHRKIEENTHEDPKKAASSEPSDHVITISVGVQGSLLVWDPEDAVVLQRDHRMQGTPIGMFPRVPVQDAFMSLPIQLMPEEAAYLRDKKLAVFVDEGSLVKMPNLVDAAEFHDARHVQVSQQIELYERLRTTHLDVHKEHVYGMLLKELQDASVKENFILPDGKDEIWSIMRKRYHSQPDEANQIVNIELPTRSWRVKLGLLKLEEIGFDYPISAKEKGLYAAYCGLKDSGFSLTSGANYGADFLVFKGDPHLVYSSYMVKVIEVAAGASLDDYLRLGRVATTAKKALLWVMVSEDMQIRFCCGKWALMK